MSNVKLIKLFIYSRKMKTNDGKKTFTKYLTKALFRIKDENGKWLEERVAKFIDVKFTNDAFEGSSVKLTDIKRGLLSVDSKMVGCPDVYEVTEEDGKKVYPTCYIRGGIASFVPVEKEHQFHFVTEEDTNEVEIEEDK